MRAILPRKTPLRPAWPALLVLGLLGCTSGPAPLEADAGAPDAAAHDASWPYREPRADLVDAIGGVDTLDVITWNIENFPKQAGTVAVVADLITSLDVDVVALQEVEDQAAFEELVARLRHFDGRLSTHTYGDGSYQKIAVLFRRDLVTAGEAVLLFQDQGYTFPRPPLQIDVQAGFLDIRLITLHLKAGRGDEDRSRRTDAVQALDQHVRASVSGGHPDLLILGDFNEVLTSQGGRAVFAPLLAQPGGFDIETERAANTGAASFLPGDVVLDHIVASATLDDPDIDSAEVIDLQAQLVGYLGGVSDHVPVLIRLPLDGRRAPRQDSPYCAGATSTCSAVPARLTVTCHGRQHTAQSSTKLPAVSGSTYSSTRSPQYGQRTRLESCMSMGEVSHAFIGRAPPEPRRSCLQRGHVDAPSPGLTMALRARTEQWARPRRWSSSGSLLGLSGQ